MHFHCRFDEFGGGERYLAELCRAQRDRGADVAVVTNQAFPTQAVDGIMVKAIAASSGMRSGLSRRKEILQLVSDFNPDIVHFHDTFLFVSPFAVKPIQRRWPTVKTVHDAGLLCFQNTVGRTKIFRQAVCRRRLGPGCFLSGCAPANKMLSVDTAMRVLELRVARNMTRTIVSSGFMMTEMRRNRFVAERIDRIPPWTVSAEEPTPPPHGRSRILYAGRLDSGKGVAHLLGAVDTLRDIDWHLDIVGDGPLESSLKKMVARIGLTDRVAFHGRVPFSAMNAYYQKCTIACVPSLVPETFGLSGIEAMARARPVIAYDSGGISEWLIDSEIGFLVPRGNVVALAARLREILLDPERGSRMGASARKKVDISFRLPRFLDALEESYEAAIQATHAATVS